MIFTCHIVQNQNSDRSLIEAIIETSKTNYRTRSCTRMNTESPIRRRPLPPFSTLLWILRTRVNHLPHHFYICIFSARFNVFIQIHQSIPISCNLISPYLRDIDRERKNWFYETNLELTFRFVPWARSKLDQKTLGWDEERLLQAKPGFPSHHLQTLPIPIPSLPAPLHFISLFFSFEALSLTSPL